jgi:serine/threonine protein kinase
MTPERWTHVREIFDQVLERPFRDRDAYLRVVCAGDDEARREVESLLASHEDSTDFLESPAANLAHAFASSAALSEDNEYPSGYRLGPYQFERRIGRGGMGSVWLATRFDPEFKRKVAIKMVKRGMNSHEILRRFRLERQMLANLDHPNIALLIDGGSTPEGLPYLVMEYVEGTRIDRYCEDRRLSITERLKLFRSVCSAVQYAHQNLVVHRDIKASNIMVAADGIPKLLDFGIAKLLPTDSSALDLAQTRPEMRPMTPEYASPEQLRGDAITTASDIYSLGVLLYRILTGKLPRRNPLPHKGVERQGTAEEVLPPSAVVLADHETAIPEATQKLEIGGESRDNARKRLRRKLQGDLDMIVLKALRENPKERYVSAEQFSEDIRLYLEERPVLARLGTPGYRWGKFLRRNALAVAASLIAGAVLIGTAGYYRYQSFLADTGRLQARRELMHTAASLGAAQLAGGDTAEAFTNFNRALDIAEELSRAESAGVAKASTDTQKALADLQMHLGEVLAASGAKGEALTRFQNARRQYLQLAPSPEAQAAVTNVDRMIAALK